MVIFIMVIIIWIGSSPTIWRKQRQWNVSNFLGIGLFGLVNVDDGAGAIVEEGG